MEQVQQSKSSQWVEHSNALLSAHARICRGNEGLKANKAAFVYRVALREQSSWYCEIARSMHLNRDPAYDPAKRPSERICPEVTSSEDLLSCAGAALSLLLFSFVGVYGAVRLFRQGLADRSLHQELTAGGM
jgi:hypothetical protein